MEPMGKAHKLYVPDMTMYPNGSFRKLGVPYFGVLVIRILIFRVLY